MVQMAYNYSPPLVQQIQVTSKVLIADCSSPLVQRNRNTSYVTNNLVTTLQHEIMK
jgi:hypothetical protein